MREYHCKICSGKINTFPGLGGTCFACYQYFVEFGGAEDNFQDESIVVEYLLISEKDYFENNTMFVRFHPALGTITLHAKNGSIIQQVSAKELSRQDAIYWLQRIKNLQAFE